MSGYPETYRPALSTITELTERSEYSRPWSSTRKNIVSGYTDSQQSFMTEYQGTTCVRHHKCLKLSYRPDVNIPPSPSQSAVERLSFYEAIQIPGSRSSSETPTPRQSIHEPETQPVIPQEFQNRYSNQPRSTPPPVLVEDILEEKPKRSKLSALASSRASTQSMGSLSSKSSRSFFVDSDSVLTYPALRPSPGSSMSLRSQDTRFSEATTSTSSHIRRAIQKAMEQGIADQDVISEPSDASTPRQGITQLEPTTPSSPTTSRAAPRATDSQGRAPSKLALLAQSKASHASSSWSPTPKLPRSTLPDAHEHNIRTKYVTPIANGPTATTAITTSYQSLGNLMSRSRSALPSSTPLTPIEATAPVPGSPQHSKASSKELPKPPKEQPKSPKQPATKSPKQSKLALKSRQSQQQKVIPEADYIEELGDPLKPLFLPPPSQHASPSSFATVLIEDIEPGSRSSGRSKGSYDRNGEPRKPKRRSHKEQPIPPSTSSSVSSGFSFDVPSPDDIIFNARKGTALGDTRTKSSTRSSSSSNNPSSAPKRVISSRA